MRLILAVGVVLAANGAGRAADPTFPSSAGDLTVHTVAQGLSHPWALAFLPDGRMLVTERPGRMRIVGRDGTLSRPLSGVPDVVARGQAGLLDVALDRDFATNRTIYFCFNFDSGGNAAIARARLASDVALDDVKIIFRQQGPGGSNNHGCRIAQAPDKICSSRWATISAHGMKRRISRSTTARSPVSGQTAKFQKTILSWVKPTHDQRSVVWTSQSPRPRLYPIDGKLWEQEHGPQGGDEINIIDKGKNYGWPVVGFGVDYGGAKIHESTHKAGMEQPVWHWTP